MRLTLDKGAVTNYELTLRTQGGRKAIGLLQCGHLQGRGGTVRGIFAAARDITDQARLQSQLAEERAYNRGLIEASVDGLVTVDEEMLITDVNETMCQMAAESRSQLIGSSFPDIFRGAGAGGGRRAPYLQGRRGHQLRSYLAGRAADKQMPVSFNAAVFRDPPGNIRGIFASARDITAQKQLESQLQASQFYTRSLIESNIDALMTTDPLGIITDVNQQMEALTGRTREELIGTPFKDYFTDPAAPRKAFARCCSKGKSPTTN